MSNLHRNVAKAQSRLMLNAFLRYAVWGTIIAAGAWSLTLLVQRFLLPGVPLNIVTWIAAALAGAITIAGTLARRATALDAALAIDRAAGLKERLSTAIVLEQSPDPFARAAVSDAEHTAGKIHVPAHVPVRAPQVWPWSVALLCVAALLAYFVKPYYLFAGTQDDQQKSQQSKMTAAERAQVTANVNEQLNKIKEFAENNPELKDLARDITPMEAPEKTDSPDKTQRDAVKKLDEIADKLAEKREAQELQALDDTKKMLQNLEQKSGSDAASKLSNALQKNDFDSAQKALQQMQDELKQAAEKTDDPQKQQQLQQAQQQMQQLAAELSKMNDTVRMEKELENKANMTPEQAKELAKKLSQMDPKQAQKELQQQLQQQGLNQQQIQQLSQKLQQKMQSQQQMQKLSQSMQQLSQAMQQCQSPGQANNSAGQQAASNAISDAMSQLSQMEMSEQAMNELQSQLNELQKMREGMANSNKPCPNCGKYGCNGNCNGQGDKPGGQSNQYGRGYGAHIGREKSEHAMKMEKAETKIGKGQIIGQMLVDGPQLKGEAQAEARDAVLSAQKEAEEAIEKDTVARQHERVVREYFERLAGLLGESKNAPAKNSKPDAKTDDAGGGKP